LLFIFVMHEQKKLSYRYLGSVNIGKLGHWFECKLSDNGED